MNLKQVVTVARAAGEDYARRWPKLGITWYDHRYDWALGPEWWMWMERGALGHHYIREGDRVLDLCCGDGMFTGLYYGKKASLVHGLDRDAGAIGLAQKLYSKNDVKFFQRDILHDSFPLPEYDAIVMFAAIEHFSAEECQALFAKIVQHLSPTGFFLGSTIKGHKDSNPEHRLEFRSQHEVETVLRPHFERIEIWSTTWYETRTDMYFLCWPKKR